MPTRDCTNAHQGYLNLVLEAEGIAAELREAALLAEGQALSTRLLLAASIIEKLAISYQHSRLLPVRRR